MYHLRQKSSLLTLGLQHLRCAVSESMLMFLSICNMTCVKRRGYLITSCPWMLVYHEPHIGSLDFSDWASEWSDSYHLCFLGNMFMEGSLGRNAPCLLSFVINLVGCLLERAPAERNSALPFVGRGKIPIFSLCILIIETQAPWLSIRTLTVHLSPYWHASDNSCTTFPVTPVSVFGACPYLLPIFIRFGSWD